MTRPKLLFVFLVMLTISSQAIAGEGKIDLSSQELSTYKLEDSWEQDLSVHYHFTTSESNLFIEETSGIDVVSSNLLIDDHIFNVKAIYLNYFSAYPGEITHTIACNDNFKPQYKTVKKDIKEYTYILFYSTKRFGLGACNEDLAAHRSITGWVYCSGKKKLYKITQHLPLQSSTQDLESFLFSLKCQEN